jgi:phage gp46-like protein
MFFKYNRSNFQFEIDPDPKHCLESAVITSLFTQSKSDDDPNLGWWGAELMESSVGSDLHKLKREKLIEESTQFARESANNAIAWLRDAGAIADYSVVSNIENHVLTLNVELEKPTNGQVEKHGFQLS